MRHIVNNRVDILLVSCSEIHFLEKSINSILHQSFLNWRLLLVDDASFNSSAEDFRYSRNENIEEMLENCFVDYFKLISSPKSCWQYKGDWHFRPDDVTYGILKIVDILFLVPLINLVLALHDTMLSRGHMQ